MTASPAGEVGVAVVGYGAMGKAHAYAYRAAPAIRQLAVRPRLVVLAGRHADRVAAAAAAYGFESSTDRWQEVLERPEVDLVDVCTPPGTHAEVVLAALAAGKAVVCEKPLSVSPADGEAMLAAARASGRPHAICFNYRFLPALSLMRQLVAEGRIGEVLLWRGCWLSDEFLDPAIPFDWRFDARLGGSTFADLGSHLVDMAHWMVGPVSEVCAQSATFTAARAGADGAAVPVEIDEASSALLRFAGGARGVLEVARTCARRPCDFTLEVNGTEGTVVFDYSRLNELRVGLRGDEERLYGMRAVRAEHPSHPYAGQWWAIGQGVGYDASFVNLFADTLERWPDGPFAPSLEDGLAAQRVCAAMERSAAERRWVEPGHGDAGTAAASGAGAVEPKEES